MYTMPIWTARILVTVGLILTSGPRGHGGCDAYTIHDVHALKTDLFQDNMYDSTVRPVVDQSDVIQVGVI